MHIKEFEQCRTWAWVRGVYPDVILAVEGVEEALVVLGRQEIEDRQEAHDDVGLHGLVALLARLAHEIDAAQYLRQDRRHA
jgi:hypothetical protein